MLFRAAVGCDLSLFSLSGVGYILPDYPQFWFRFPVQEGISAFNREKPAYDWKSHAFLPVWLSGDILQMELTSNSTY
jgi:hypothetical protein